MEILKAGLLLIVGASLLISESSCGDAPPPVCPAVCSLFCLFGNSLDDFNCPLCECQDDPCTFPGCLENQFCGQAPATCLVPPCNPPFVPICTDCPTLRCTDVCEFGTTTDENGCPTCDCNNPCDLVNGGWAKPGVSCAGGETCPFGTECEDSSSSCCPTTNGVLCPVTSVLCIISPCAVISCGAFPTAECRPNFCGGCNADFYVNGEIVDCTGNCPPVCPIYCFYGNVLDANGCPTCECLPRPCEAPGGLCGPGSQCTGVAFPSCTQIAKCFLSAETGPCDGFEPRWYYNSLESQCRLFSYGGCPGNDNNFQSLAECQSACAGTGQCTLAADSGPCYANFERWFYNEAAQECQTFTYGGCFGNANRFQTKGDCERACGNSCDLAPDAGPCYAYEERWYFDAAQQTCLQFAYSGCEGNGNNFLTQAACENKCGNPCLLAADFGPCSALETRWAYNNATGTCSQFTYGGCQGNANNFLDQATCEDVCNALTS